MPATATCAQCEFGQLELSASGESCQSYLAAGRAEVFTPSTSDHRTKLVETKREGNISCKLAASGRIFRSCRCCNSLQWRQRFISKLADLDFGMPLPEGFQNCPVVSSILNCVYFGSSGNSPICRVLFSHSHRP